MRTDFGIFIMSVIVVLCGFLSGGIVFAGDMKDLHNLMDTADNQQIDVTEITKNKTAEKIAKQTLETFHSRAFQKKLQAQIDTLRTRLIPTEERAPSISLKEAGRNTFLMPGEKIYLFISSSMPETTLRNYAKDLDKLNDENIVLVIQGFVGGIKFIQPTLEFIQNIRKKSPSCDPKAKVCDAFNAGVYIDPLAFARYGITTVPTFVYARNENAENFSEAYRVSGEVSIEYALELIEKESKSCEISNVLRKLRKGFY